ncbi:hypothetical protein GQ600_17808 [Phytophthora cactorum]|nr:hypothetical protein GQ600_17808 [Phytophthora cactorum]
MRLHLGRCTFGRVFKKQCNPRVDSDASYESIKHWDADHACTTNASWWRLCWRTLPIDLVELGWTG